MKLYASSDSLGLAGAESEYVELTPKVVSDLIRDAVVFVKIGFDFQIIVDYVLEYPSEEKRTEALMNDFSLTKRQAMLLQTMSAIEILQYYNKDEFYKQMKRLKNLRCLLE